MEGQIQKLKASVSDHEFTLRNFNEHPDFQDSVKTSDNLQKFIQRLQSQEWRLADLVRARLEAQASPPAQRRIAFIIEAEKNQLKMLETRHVSEKDLTHKRGLIWELEAPISDLEEVARLIQLEALTTQEAINQSKLAYCRAKKRVEDDLKNLEEQLDVTSKNKFEWAMRDRERLVFFLDHDTRRAKALRAFQQAHPEQDIKDLQQQWCPTLAATSQTLRVLHQRRSKPSNGDSSQVVQTLVADEKAWQFILVSKCGEEYPLAENKKRAIDVLSSVLLQCKCSVSADRVLQQLNYVASLSVHQRSALQQPVAAGLAMWKYIRIGRNYRTFLQIDEHARVIRFYVRNRRDAFCCAPPS